MTITVKGRAVAELGPISTRPTTLPWQVLRGALAKAPADAALRDELAETLSDTTDDLGLADTSLFIEAGRPLRAEPPRGGGRVGGDHRRAPPGCVDGRRPDRP
ncbi:MAG: hypothetical protein ACRDVM_01675 [Acidimicrobiia bacterium]